MPQKFKNAIKKRLPRVAAGYRKLRDQMQRLERPKMTPFGFKMVGPSAMREGSFEPEDTKLFRRFAADMDVIVNAGANVGYYCLHALGMDKHVIAFEPMPVNAAMLRKNIAANGWQKNAEVFQMALADKQGELPMYGQGTGASLIKGWGGFHTGTPTIVPVRTMDTALGNKLAGKKVLVLIDVEGREYELLKGAETILSAKPKPTWIVEIAFAEHQPAGHAVNENFLPTFELFWKHGYKAYGVGRDGMHALSEQAIRTDGGAVKKELLSSNFIFIHP